MANNNSNINSGIMELHQQSQRPLFIKEFLDLSPVGLRTWGSIEGQSIHSNEQICNHVKDWIYKSSITKNISGKISELIDNKRILIGYEDKSKFKFLIKIWRAWRNQPASKGYLGYFSKMDNKIGIILDENVGLIGKAIREIPPILVHELVHMCFFNNHRNIFSYSMKKYFLPFYLKFLEELSVENLDPLIISKYIYKLSLTTESHKSAYTPFGVREVMEIWRNLFEDLNVSKDNSIKLSKMVMIPFLHQMRIYNNDKIFIEVLKKMDNSYSRIGLKNVLSITIPVQEVVFPSEIVCIINQFNLDPNISRFIEQL